MKKYIFPCLLLAVLVFNGVAAAQDNRQVVLKTGDRILFLGDSLTYLAGKEEPKQQVTKGSGILTYDGNHFNDAGMRFVAEQMLKRFK